MNIIDKTALQIATFIRNNNPEAGSEIALKYSSSLFINTASSILISLIICLCTSRFIEGVCVIFSYLILRFFSGGFHLKSSLSCCVFSIILYTLLAHLSFNYWYFGLFLNTISLLIVLLKAPQGIEEISRIDKKYYPLLKIISLCIIGSNIFLQSSLLSLVFFAQSLTLLNLTYRIFNFMEGRFVK